MSTLTETAQVSDETLACADAVQRFLAAEDEGVGDIVMIARGQVLRRTQLRELLRLAYGQRESQLRAALDYKPEYGVELDVFEDDGDLHKVVYRCTTLADAQEKAVGSQARIPGAPQPRVMRRLVGPWSPAGADAR